MATLDKTSTSISIVESQNLKAEPITGRMSEVTLSLGVESPADSGDAIPTSAESTDTGNLGDITYGSSLVSSLARMLKDKGLSRSQPAVLGSFEFRDLYDTDDNLSEEALNLEAVIEENIYAITGTNQMIDLQSALKQIIYSIVSGGSSGVEILEGIRTGDFIQRLTGLDYLITEGDAGAARQLTSGVDTAEEPFSGYLDDFEGIDKDVEQSAALLYSLYIAIQNIVTSLDVKVENFSNGDWASDTGKMDDSLGYPTEDIQEHFVGSEPSGSSNTYGTGQSLEEFFTGELYFGDSAYNFSSRTSLVVQLLCDLCASLMYGPLDMTEEVYYTSMIPAGTESPWEARQECYNTTVRGLSSSGVTEDGQSVETGAMFRDKIQDALSSLEKPSNVGDAFDSGDNNVLYVYCQYTDPVNIAKISMFLVRDYTAACLTHNNVNTYVNSFGIAAGDNIDQMMQKIVGWDPSVSRSLLGSEMNSVPAASLGSTLVPSVNDWSSFGDSLVIPFDIDETLSSDGADDNAPIYTTGKRYLVDPILMDPTPPRLNPEKVGEWSSDLKQKISDLMGVLNSGFFEEGDVIHNGSIRGSLFFEHGLSELTSFFLTGYHTGLPADGGDWDGPSDSFGQMLRLFAFLACSKSSALSMAAFEYLAWRYEIRREEDNASAETTENYSNAVDNFVDVLTEVYPAINGSETYEEWYDEGGHTQNEWVTHSSYTSSFSDFFDESEVTQNLFDSGEMEGYTIRDDYGAAALRDYFYSFSYDQIFDKVWQAVEDFEKDVAQVTGVSTDDRPGITSGLGIGTFGRLNAMFQMMVRAASSCVDVHYELQQKVQYELSNGGTYDDNWNIQWRYCPRNVLGFWLAELGIAAKDVDPKSDYYGEDRWPQCYGTELDSTLDALQASGAVSPADIPDTSWQYPNGDAYGAAFDLMRTVVGYCAAWDVNVYNCFNYLSAISNRISSSVESLNGILTSTEVVTNKYSDNFLDFLRTDTTLGSIFMSTINKEQFLLSNASRYALAWENRESPHLPAGIAVLKNQIKCLGTVMLASHFIRTLRTGRKRIFTVGLPAGFMEYMRNITVSGRNDVNYRDSNLIYILVHKRNMMDDSEVYSPKVFAFDVSKFIIEGRAGIADASSSFADGQDVNAVVSNISVQTFSPSPSDTSATLTGKVYEGAVLTALGLVGDPKTFYALGGSGINPDQTHGFIYSDQIYHNHVVDYYLKTYLKITLGIDVSELAFFFQDDDTHYGINPETSIQYPDPDKRVSFKNSAERLARSDYPEAGGLDPDMGQTLEYQRVLSETARSVIYSPNKYENMCMYPKMFERTFCMLIDESDFELWESEDPGDLPESGSPPDTSDLVESTDPYSYTLEEADVSSATYYQFTVQCVLGPDLGKISRGEITTSDLFELENELKSMQSIVDA